MVVLPLLVFPLFLIGYTSFLSARSGITKIAEEFLKYKATEMFKYCGRQQDILVSAGLSAAEDYQNLARRSAEEYADTIKLSDTGYFMAVSSRGEVVFPKTSAADVGAAEFFGTMKEKKLGLIDFSLGGVRRVGYFIYFEPWDWYILLSEQEKTFFEDANNIKKQVAFTLAVTILCAVGLILFFIKKLTDPVGTMVSTMKEIITTRDLGKRVRVEYDDEIGSLATWFNRMVGDLEDAYNQIKQYAYKSVLSQRNEERIRHIFQKYVPAEVIDEVLKMGADKLLVGKKQTATILFSDIRGFTSISEKLTAEQLFTSLNTYFNIMVGIIMEYEGIIDKFIGDAIMAIFGAPISYGNDAELAVYAAIEMLSELEKFRNSLPPNRQFHIRIGVNTGMVVAGYLGSSQRLEYTVLGDSVNVASRLETLAPPNSIYIGEATYRRVKGAFKLKDLGSMQLKGKEKKINVYMVMHDFKDMTDDISHHLKPPDIDTI